LIRKPRTLLLIIFSKDATSGEWHYIWSYWPSANRTK